ncbi:MAG: 4-(cytidine 5'-diphospho)-2-C-methyl-D-erythritol kinase [Acholeplasmatales bacterium]|nr:4-(cytidine 5'-diphospho)-2-C-methyl-D-erythritol kinase [Acholeplasmatales bacterium]
MIRENAYAKINLALDVSETLVEGYHNVKNVMVPIELCDRLTFEHNESDIVLLDNTPIKMTDNLIYKAAKLFLDTYKIKKGVLITLEKNIPSEAGLAGGSADAAATLRGLNMLFEVNASLDELAKLSASLGSDIPYCVYDKPALCTGRGTEIELLDTLYPHWDILLVKPPFGCSTKDIYQNYSKIDNNQDKKLLNIFKALKTGDFNLLVTNIFNDLEHTAYELKPELKEIRDDLAKSSFTMMSGSGSTLVVFSKKKEVLDKLCRILPNYLTKIITKLK